MNTLRKIIFFAIFGFITAFGATSSFAATGDSRDLLLRSLAENIYDNVGAEDGVIIASDSLVEFFSKNVDICKDYLLARTSEEDIHIAEKDLTVDIRWDYVLEEVAAAMTISSGRRNLFVCENDRSIQAGIDVALWAATAVAAIYSFGSGGVAVQGARVGITQAAKNLVKIGVKKGAKTAAVEAVATRVGADIVGKTAAKTAAVDAATTAATQFAAKEAAALTAKTAAETAARQALTQFNKHAGTVAAKTALQNSGKKRITEKMLEAELKATISGGANASAKAEAQAALDLLTKRQAAAAARKTAQQAYKTAAAETITGNQAAAQAVTLAENALLAETALATKALNRALATFAISTPLAAVGGIASVYSFLESGFDPKIMNCTNTDKDNGCYLSCTKDNLASPNDDLNTKVFKPVFGKNLCVDENTNYVLREIPSGGLPMAGDVFVAANEKQWERARQIIVSEVQDKGNCDWNEDDVDMYIGAPMYDPSTLEPQAEGMALVIDGIRLDD